MVGGYTEMLTSCKKEITGERASLNCCGMVRHVMLTERVGSMHTHKHYVCTSLVQNAVCMCCDLCRRV